jgi:hypothetical protein
MLTGATFWSCEHDVDRELTGFDQLHVADDPPRVAHIGQRGLE